MRNLIEELLRKAAWFPGLGFLDDWANNLTAKWGKYQQTTGDYKARYEVRKRALGLSGVPKGEGGDKESTKTANGDMHQDGNSDTPNEKRVATKESTGSLENAGGTPAQEETSNDRITPRGTAATQALAAEEDHAASPNASKRMPSIIAWTTFIFLLVTLVAVWIALYANSRNVPWQHSMAWWRIPLQILLVIAIPIVIHRALRYWLEGDFGRYPDIDFAWKQGLASLRHCKVNLRESPIFLVLGTGSPELEQSLVDASGVQFSSAQVPPGPSALHWNISHQGIFLFAPGIGWTSGISQAAYEEGLLQPDPTDSPSVGVSSTKKYHDENRLASLASVVQLDRLRYLCELLRVNRYPACALNGILIVVPQAFATESSVHSGEREKALVSDLDVIRVTTQIACPITMLITGMEEEAGFREIIRRVGPGRAKLQRFGKSFDAGTVKSENLMHAFGIHVCGTFEDWTYLLFREKDALSRPGNLGLFELLCNIRCSFKPKLSRLLAHTFSDDNLSEPIHFSGCYFAATGDSADRQGFVKAVFDKVIEEQELLRWTAAARIQDARNRRWALWGAAMLVLSISGLLTLFVSEW